MSFVMRNITETDEVMATKDAYEAKNRHIGNAWAGLTWSLSIEPTPPDSILLEDENAVYRLYTQAGEASNGVPSISVIYTHDDTMVHFVAVRFNDSSPVLMEDAEALATTGN